VCEREDRPKESRPYAASSSRLFGCESCQPQDWEGISRETLSSSLRNALGCDLRRRDRSEAENAPIVHCHVRRANVMTELVLPSEALEKAIEVDVSGAEPRPIIVRP
jgi:hypothetical protein